MNEDRYFIRINFEGKWAFACLEGSQGSKWLDGIAAKYYGGKFPETYQVKSPYGMVDFRLGGKDAVSPKQLLRELVDGNIVADGQIDELVFSHNEYNIAPVLFPAPNDEPIHHIATWFNQEGGGTDLEVFRH